MTPHGTVEDMARLKTRLGPRFSEVFAPEIWDIAASGIVSAVHFELGATIPRGEHIEFANDLMAKGLFQLPFEETFFTGNMIPHTGILAMQPGVGKDIRWIVFAPSVDRATQERFMSPLSVGELVAKDHATGFPISLDKGTVNWKSCTRFPHYSRKTGTEWGVDQHEAASEKALRAIMGVAVLLMSKDIDVRIEPAPEKLNKQRIAKGRPPIGERRFIRIKPERVASYVNAAGEFAAARAGPCMHWRRGHFRKIGEGRVVPVAPTIVNASDDARPVAKQYRVG